jgi:hypothetical protein
MHPIERLRYVARSSGGDQRMLVRETAGALRGLGFDPAGLVVACRRIVERHPNSGPLWWLCASVLAAPDPYRCAAALADDIEMDPTPDLLVDALPDNATVCVVGWPDLIGEALLRRGDATVLAVESDDEGMGSAAFVRRLHHGDVDAEIVPASGAAAAVLSSDLVVIEAMAASATELLATQGSRARWHRSPIAPRFPCGPSWVVGAVCPGHSSRRWAADRRSGRCRGRPRPSWCRSP